jgi:putative transposase
VLTEGSGQVTIEVPREWAGTFEPQTVRKRRRRLTRVQPDTLTSSGNFVGALNALDPSFP